MPQLNCLTVMMHTCASRLVCLSQLAIGQY